MTIRIGTYNVNNLFERAKVLQLTGFSSQAAPVLKDVEQLNELLASDSYAGVVGKKIVKLLEKYNFHKKAGNPWFTINQIRNKLFKVKKNPAAVELTVNGRADWLGWCELTREYVDEASTDNTARVVQAVNAGVLCVVEVEDRLTLDRFNHHILKKFQSDFDHDMLVDGNDERGIDVGLLSRHPIRTVRSHIDDTYTGQNGREYPIFSRDCAEFEIALPNGKSLWILCNHFKSKGYGSPATNDARRKLQADRVRAILAGYDLTHDLVVVAGDFNDTPGSAPLAGLLQTPNLSDVLASPLLSGPRWTYQDAKGQIDYLLVSKELSDHLQAVGIERRGIYDKKNFKGQFTHFPEVASKANQASDHAAVWAEFNI